MNIRVYALIKTDTNEGEMLKKFRGRDLETLFHIISSHYYVK